jgi:branched-chain amino acid aminotransferase
MLMLANVNGRICTPQEATVSVFDGGFLFGEGIYETIRTYNQEPFLLDRHFRRLRTSAEMIALDPGKSDAELECTLRDTMAACVADDAADGTAEMYIRLLITRGVGNMSYDPGASPTPGIIVIVKPLVPPPQAIYDQGVKVSLVSVVRNHPGALNPLMKSNNLLNNALAMQEAIRHKSFEAVLRNYRGELAECSQSTLFLVKGGTVLTPRLGAGLLAGITREFLTEVARDVGVPMESAVLRDDDLFAADEVFLTGTTRELVPIVRVDDRIIADGAPGPITLRLLQAYRQRAHEISRPPA